MYLYILALHSGSRRKPGAGAQEWLVNDDAKGNITLGVPSVSSRDKDYSAIFSPNTTKRAPVSYQNSHDLRGNPPLGQPSRARTETEALGVRLWYSKQAVEPATLEKVLADAYAFGFGKHSQLEDRAGTVLEQRLWGGRPNSSVSVYMKSEYKFCVTRIELPEGMEESGAEEDLLPFWDASGTPLTLRPREIQMYTENAPTVSIPYLPPPKEFRTLEDIQRFADYVASMNAMEKAKASWRGEMVSDDNVMGKDDEFGRACPMDSFEGMGSFRPLDVFQREKEKVAAGLSRNRVLLVKPVGLAQPPTRALMPCDTTPWFGTDLLPEFEVEAVNWDPSVGWIEKDTLSALAEKFIPVWWPLKIPGSFEVKIPERAQEKPVAPAPKFPHQEDLDVLWEVFTREYIQSPKRKEGLPSAPIPNSILIAVWKMLAFYPKTTNIFGNPQHENTILRKKSVPKDWQKVITSEVLTEYFYAKNESFNDCILYSFHCGAFLTRLFKFYDISQELINDNIDWSTVPAVDPTPLIVAFTNPAGLTEDHKKAWISFFVRDTMEKKEKAVAGSQQTYDEFVGWIRNGLYAVGGTQFRAGIRDELITQFPIAEFTRLMKENGHTMTRRARGMVYVGITLRSKRDDDWTVESGERAPTDGEILPGPTGGAEAAASEGDGVTGIDAIADAEGNWATP